VVLRTISIAKGDVAHCTVVLAWTRDIWRRHARGGAIRRGMDRSAYGGYR